MKRFRLDSWIIAPRRTGLGTAKIVHQAAAKFKPKWIGKPSQAAKKSPTQMPNLKPAFKLIGEIEKLGVRNKPLLAKAKALRTCLLGLEGR